MTTSATALREYGQYRELFNNLTLRELRSKYKRSVLGWTWSMVNPLANMVVYTIVFHYFLRAQLKPAVPSGLNVYALFLLCAMLPFNFFQSNVMASMSNLIGNANLIKKTYFPRELIPASTVASGLVSHLIEMALLLVALLAFGNYRAIFFLPGVLVMIAIVMVFAVGLGLLFSITNVFFRDIEHFSAILFFIWMYLTPVVYPLSLVGNIKGHGHLIETILKINPMTDVVQAFRALMYDGTFPSFKGVGYAAFWAIGSLVVGLWVFRKYEGRLAEEL